jgi:hypothetical protein
MPIYELYGRKVQCNVKLAGEPSEVSGLPDWELKVLSAEDAAPQSPREGKVVAGSDDDKHAVVIIEDESGYLLHARDLADLRFSSDLRTATCHPLPGVTPDHIRELMTTVISAWLVLSGTAVFHGSAVTAVPGFAESYALAFLGPSLAGKSTWASLLCTLGARFATDDALAVTAVDGQPALAGGCDEIRLRQPPLSPPSSASTADATWRPTVDGRLAVALPRWQRFPVPFLGLVFLEERHHGTGLSLEPLGGSAAVLRLAASHRLASWKLRSAQTVHFSRSIELAQSVPAFVLRAPRVKGVCIDDAQDLLHQLRSAVLASS